MKPESQKLRNKTLNSHHDQASSSYDFSALSEALNDSDVSIKKHNSYHVGAALAQVQDSHTVQSLSKDCYDFTSLSETLNNISNQNEESSASDSTSRVSKEFSMKIKKSSPIKLSRRSEMFKTIKPRRLIRPTLRVRQNAEPELRDEILAIMCLLHLANHKD